MLVSLSLFSFPFNLPCIFAMKYLLMIEYTYTFEKSIKLRIIFEIRIVEISHECINIGCTFLFSSIVCDRLHRRIYHNESTIYRSWINKCFVRGKYRQRLVENLRKKIVKED